MTDHTTDPVLDLPSTDRTVADLNAGDVFSLPGTDLGPALIDAISHPVGGVRQILTSDPYDGVASTTRSVLGLHRAVVVHEVVAEHHAYTNVTGETLTNAGANWHYADAAAPGETIAFTGVARPDLFDAELWDHTVTPVVTEQEEWPT